MPPGLSFFCQFSFPLPVFQLFSHPPFFPCFSGCIPFSSDPVSLFLLHRLVVPNKGYSSLDQSPDEKPLVALDTDRSKYRNESSLHFINTNLNNVLFCFFALLQRWWFWHVQILFIRILFCWGKMMMSKQTSVSSSQSPSSSTLCPHFSILEWWKANCWKCLITHKLKLCCSDSSSRPWKKQLVVLHELHDHIQGKMVWFKMRC